MALKIWVSLPFFYPDMNRPWGELLDDMLSIVDAAEELGFEGVAINENQFQNYVTNPTALGIALVAAARTKRVHILPGVVVLPNYHPLQLASQMALLDHMAPGRVGIGVARGGARFNLERMGIDPDKVKESTKNPSKSFCGPGPRTTWPSTGSSTRFPRQQSSRSQPPNRIRTCGSLLRASRELPVSHNRGTT